MSSASCPGAEPAAIVLKGTAVSCGIASGHAWIWKDRSDVLAGIPACLDSIPIGGPAGNESREQEESGRLAAAIEEARQQLRALRERLTEQLGATEAQIFGAQAAMLDDPLFAGQLRAAIEQNRASAEEAVRRTVSALVEKFERLGDARLRERAADISDLGKRLLANLSGKPAEGAGARAAPPATAGFCFPGLEGEAARTPANAARDGGQGVIFADELTPSETACLDPQTVLAIVTERGGATSHAAILARALGIPAVVAVRGALALVKQGDTVIVDGASGEVILHPGADLLASCRQRAARPRISSDAGSALKHLPAATLDGFHIEVGANISGRREAGAALENGADGVGLLRSEFLFIDRDELPGEEEQFEAYKKVLARLAPRRVVIRTADIGGDKELPAMRLPAERNPALGLRGIRLSLRDEAFFAVQLRALLRAARFGNLAILLPMVSDVAEIRRTREVVCRITKELQEAAERPPIALGIMVETPAAALMAEEMARYADFFSVGTNDLTQYVLAVDRLSAEVAHLYQPFHPAVLRLIERVSKAAEHAGKRAGICGEMAADPLAVILFTGMHVRELSASPRSIPLIKQVIRSVRLSEAEQLVERVLQLETPAQVREMTAEFARSKVQADVFENADDLQ